MRLAPRQPARLSSQITRRTQAQSPPPQNEDIYTNSLRKTLEAHRASNRARLIRKVYSRHDPPGLFRPYIPPENRAGYQPPSPPQLESPPAHIPQEASADQTTAPSSKRSPRSRSRIPSSKAEATLPLLSPGHAPAIRSIEAKDPSDLGQTPWLRYLPTTEETTGPGIYHDASTYLDAEILALHHYMKPTPEEQDTITRLSREISSLLETVVPSAPLLFGSRRTGLALAHSNLDFLLPVKDESRSPDRTRRPSPNRPQIRDAHLALLRRVEEKLRDTAEFQYQSPSPPVTQDRRPDLVHLSHSPGLVLRARHRPTGLLFQFHCGEGIPALTEYIQDYLVEYPSLAPLYTSARTLLEAHGLIGSQLDGNKPTAPGTATGTGISPDALLMLLVAFSKLHHGQFPGPHRLGDQFLAFLKLYGKEIDFRSTGVAVDPPRFFNAQNTPPPPPQSPPSQSSNPTRAPTKNQYQAHAAALRGQRSLLSTKRTAATRGNIPATQRLCVQDPTHFMNDLGRSCARTAQIQSVFATAYDQLRVGCDAWEGEGKGAGVGVVSSESGSGSRSWLGRFGGELRSGLGLGSGSGLRLEIGRGVVAEAEGGNGRTVGTATRTILGTALRAKFDGFETMRGRIVR
ncbi:Non-canonical poly(A) RNA polymerase [Penicillium ucsense]|uniref:Non-canonical poly(A) RNA polymerase n=1 Tax=Penicillium ucsense TaxID=2839758 RepID=A0A8J8W0A9_9EURO|nr:Non-canonical poly(A) RNA polymerase [Penicillium ucsense]KAF7734798.1 Non-canonical poly(A) RNA polymerase [Penicillium ucsense]